jgi:hypothetical protein
MPTLPSQADINAIEKTLQPYFMALGKVAHAWNHLHEELGKLFCAVTELDYSIGMAIWHSLKSDKGQRDILDGATRAAARSNDWVQMHPSAESGVLYITKKVQSLSDKRNDAIHAPCHALPGLDEFEITPIPFWQNPRAKNLRGKDILKEFEWYERIADVLRNHASDCCYALSAQTPWPDEPQLPALGQEHPLD